MKKRVAIFPGGTEIGLEIHNALKYSTHLELYGFTSIKDHSNYVYKNYIMGIPFYSDVTFIDKLNEHIVANEIDFIFPAHDDVQLILTENANRIKAEVLTTEVETVRICRSKIKTYEFLKNENFVPKFYYANEAVDNYPVFTKPDIGQGARGVKIINKISELESVLQENTKVVICEYLPGEEYTIDCFTDFKGNLRVCKLRNRKRIKAGISVNSEILPMDNEVYQIARTINEKLKFNGAWFFQLKRDKSDNYKLLEIAPRVSGTMGLSRNTGINYSLLTIFNAMKMPVAIIENSYNIEVDRALISRYNVEIEYDNVYIDLDDTLINNKKVNTFLMMFLYQAVNNHKNLYLISRHIDNIEETLSNNKITLSLFDSIIHLKQNESKADYINSQNSIFIDDSFSERLSVANKNIPVFDLDSIECLIDWRI
jgi:carbamoylphosphate synthase large subunit